MYHVVFHPKAIDDLLASIPAEAIKQMISKTENRLGAHCAPDGRVIKRLQHVVVRVFFEYKVRADWRAIFYLDEAHREVRVLGFVPKNVGHRLFDRALDRFVLTRYQSLFSA